MDDSVRLHTQLKTAVSIAVNLLVRGEYEALDRLTSGRLVSANLLRRAVEEYGKTLVEPPRSAWDEIDAVQAPDLKPATFHVVFPLWTKEEGPSDLTLELRLVEAYPGALETEVVDLHVL
jgi:hypothetical protein